MIKGFFFLKKTEFGAVDTYIDAIKTCTFNISPVSGKILRTEKLHRKSESRIRTISNVLACTGHFQITCGFIIETILKDDTICHAANYSLVHNINNSNFPSPLA